MLRGQLIYPRPNRQGSILGMLKSVRNRRADALTRLSWQDFERLLVDHYRSLGYEVVHHGTGSSGARSDGGIDLKLRKDAEFILVQCKHWNAMQVPHNDVHQLMGIMDNEDATGAILVTSGEFTVAAQSAAAKKGKVQLVDGVALRQMLGARLPPDLPRDVPPSLPPHIDGNRRPEPPAPLIFSRQGRVRSQSRRSTSSSKKAIFTVVGFVLFVALALIVRDRLLKVIAGLGPQSRVAAATPDSRDERANVFLDNANAPVHPSNDKPALQRAGQPDALRTMAGVLEYDAAAAIGDQAAARRAFDATHRQFMRDAKIADVRYPAKQVAGVRSAVWLDRENLLLIVDRNEGRAYPTIDAVCLALQPLGDTLGVVVNLQSGAASNGDELQTLSRNCQLEPGDRAFLQANRQVDVISPAIRAEHRANNAALIERNRQSNAESMKILEATTPALKD
jgi:hypothetical protein